jgi:type IX secretion system PorP/SprF family membrane protein
MTGMKSIYIDTIRKGFLFLIVMITVNLASDAQDVHFSQFYSTPLLVNPAMTGIFDGKFRVTNNYRSQWGSFGSGYSTIHLSGDMPIGKSRFKHDYFGLGLLIYYDKAGDAQFTQTIIEGSLAYTISLDQGDNYLAFGFRGGINSRSIDLSKTTWDSQWDGDVFNPSLPSTESQLAIQSLNLDMTAGLMWYYIPDGRNTVCIGGSFAHLTSPNVSFNSNGSEEDILNNRITAHGSAEICLDDYSSAWFAPKVLAQFQGNQREIVAGAFLKTRLQLKSKYTNYRKDFVLSGGAFYRLQDAIIIAVRAEYTDFGIGISYDFTTSDLSKLAGSAGGPEFTLSYIMGIRRGQRNKHYNKMPRFF